MPTFAGQANVWGLVGEALRCAMQPPHTDDYDFDYDYDYDVTTCPTLPFLWYTPHYVVYVVCSCLP
jgi:hypothetical protein